MTSPPAAILFGLTIAEAPRTYRFDPGTPAQPAGALATRSHGLTPGVHSRIEAFVGNVRDPVLAAKPCVGRSVTGAVVRVQPFGSEGLSGTTPKAGGPHALLRYAVERAVPVNVTAQGGDPALLNP